MKEERAKASCLEGFSVVTATRKRKYIKNIFENYQRQFFSSKELIIIINNDELNKEEFLKYSRGRKDIQLLQVPESVSLGKCLNIGYAAAKYKYIAKFDDDDYYGRNYLRESYEVFNKKKCDVVCKTNIFYYLCQYEVLIAYPYVQDYTRKSKSGAGATICMTQENFNEVPYSDMKKGVDIDFFSKCRKADKSIYSTGSYNYLCTRSKDLQEHTWQIEAEQLRSRADRKFGVREISFAKACEIVGQSN